MADEIGGVKELRLALVCYGGTSLAIYMHGIAKELQALVVASTAYESGQNDNPFEATRSEHTWWTVLDERARATGVRTRVVVDIISGTSAGGINGIFLAKALSQNVTQEALTNVWLEKGDISLLLSGPRRLPVKMRAALFALGIAINPKKSQAPLNGDNMCGWLIDAFAAMDTSEPALENAETLVPEGQSLDLFATTTDYRGRQRAIPIDSPRWIRDRAYRHLLEFHHTPNSTQFSERYSPMLAFAARATSSIPGGFPPVSLRAFENTDGHKVDLEPLLPEFFPQYELAGVDPRETMFLDGAVLDNAPFAASIGAIPKKIANTQTDRRLLYIEPDPSLDTVAQEALAAASWLKTVWTGMAVIPRREPIVDDISRLADRNEDVLRVRDVIESSFDSVRSSVREIIGPDVPTDVNAEHMATWLQEACEKSIAQSGFGHATYSRLRIHSVVDGFAAEVSAAARYSTDSFQARFVTEMMRTWASTNGLLAQDTRLDNTQMQFMSDFDLRYTTRQIRFAISALNWWYRGDTMAPSRAELDTSKQVLYQRLHELGEITEALVSCPSVVEAMKTVFDAGNIFMSVDNQEPLAGILARHTGVFEDMQREIGSQIKQRLTPLAHQLHEDVIDMCREWNPKAREDFLVRYIGFPFWDVLTFPVQELSGVNERDAVQVARLSPRDVSLLHHSGENKLTGVETHHFGAFFSRKNRENDYLWGRLDGVERFMALLTDAEDKAGLTSPDPVDCGRLFEAILEQEEDRLTTVKPLIADLRVQSQILQQTSGVRFKG